MVTAASLQDQLSQKVRELSQIVSPLSEEQASSPLAPGEWCVKEVLSHLMGEETQGFIGGIKRFVEADNPVIDVTPGVTFFEQRRGKSARELMSQVEARYSEIGRFVGGLTEDQLSRKATIPLLKETPLGENVTLAQWTGALINFHLNDHIGQLRTLTQA
ncbi:MAG: DinB family protein [Dehalococcoidia bacterium]|nr:DinB family protein [Dehalococcoidia bacterium]